MVSTLAALRTLVLAAAALSVHSVDAFTTDSTPVETVPASLKGSSGQSYLQRWTVRGLNPFPIRDIKTRLAGRVVIKHAENTTSDSSATKGDTFARITVSGATKSAVEQFKIDIQRSSIYTDETVSLTVKDFLDAPLSLVVEVELLRKNALKKLVKSGGADVLIGENVLYSADKDPFLNAPGYESRDVVELSTSEGLGNVFVSDASAALVVPKLTLTASEGDIQVDVGSIKVNKTTNVMISKSGNLSLLTKKLEADVTLMKGDDSTGKLCITAENTPKVSYPVGGDEAFASYPGKKGDTFKCTTRTLPTYVSMVGSGSSTTSSDSTGAGTVKPSSGSASSSTTAPTPAPSAASASLSAATGLVLVAAVAALQTAA